MRRKHDPFFRYIYAIPENARTLLRLAQYKNAELRRMLASVDMRTLEPIPGSYSNVKEWGASDFGWYPTKAIIIYNGQKDWDPMAEFRAKYRGEFNGGELPLSKKLNYI